MFRNFIITRYNLQIPGWEYTKDHEKIDDDWMDHRFRLFKNYCLPSVKNQGNQNFTWLIFMNLDTKENRKREINEITKDYSNIRILYSNGYKYFLKDLHKTISEELYDAQYLITTRLDNDDCLRNDFIQLVQNEFNSQDKCIIDFPRGLSLEIEPQVRLAYRKIRLNPFISLIEKADSFQTVMYYFGHRRWEREKIDFISIRNCRPWLQIIHSKNKRNTMRGLILSKKSDLLTLFGINISDYHCKINMMTMAEHFILTFLFRLKGRLPSKLFNSIY